MLVLCSVYLMGNIHLRQKASIFTQGNSFFVLLLKALQPSPHSSLRILKNVSSSLKTFSTGPHLTHFILHIRVFQAIVR